MSFTYFGNNKKNRQYVTGFMVFYEIKYVCALCNVTSSENVQFFSCFNKSRSVTNVKSVAGMPLKHGNFSDLKRCQNRMLRCAMR